MKAENKIFTVPEQNTRYEPWFITGNHYVSLPMIRPADGGIECVNLLSMAAASLIEYCGSSQTGLFRPFVTLQGKDLFKAGKISWDYEDYWIPAFTLIYYENGVSLEVKGKIVAPLDLRGFIYHLEVINHTGQQLNFSEQSINNPRELILEAGIKGELQSVQKTVFSQRLIPGRNHIYHDRWTDSIVLEHLSWENTGALALGWGQALSSLCAGNSEADNKGREGLYYCVTNHITLQPGGSLGLNYFVAAGMERDGARTSVVDMKRNTMERKYSELRAWLQNSSINTGQSGLNGVLNKNLFFNYFFAAGRSIDTEETVMITSRSPRYYVSAAYWPRDTFLWSYPALLLVDCKLAKEVLIAGYSRHLKNGGIHAQYINGTVLYPGFELDQLCSYIIALKNYQDYCQDSSVFAESVVVRGIELFLRELDKHKEDCGLYGTFLDPSDDPVTYPCLVYNNVLVWAALDFLAGINEQHKFIQEDLHIRAASLKEAIDKHGIVDYKGKRMYAWGVDGKGNFEIYDNPPGSLLTLLHYGFDVDEEVWKNTVDWIISGNNPYYSQTGNFTGLGSVHAGGPWILGVANCILAGFTAESAGFLEKAVLDNGFACETVDEVTGLAKTGNAFATCAGFLAYAIYMGFHKGGLTDNSGGGNSLHDKFRDSGFE